MSHRPESARPGSALRQSHGSRRHVHETAKTKKESDGTGKSHQRGSSRGGRHDGKAQTSGSSSAQVAQSSRTGKPESEESEEDSDDDFLIKPSDLIYQPDSVQRNWLRKHGKGAMIDFEDEQLVKLRKCFDSLADVADGNDGEVDEEEKALGVDDLEDPLIALGLVENRQQVQ